MNCKIGLAVLLAVPAVALAAASVQEKKPQEKAPAAEFQMAPTQPGPHHARMKDLAGTWELDCEMMMDPSAPPTKSKAVEVDTTVGGLWNVMDAKGEFGGMPFHGHGLAGYDSTKKKHVGVWVDNFGDYLSTSEGDCDGTCKIETTYGDTPNPMGGGSLKVKNVHEWTDKDNRTFTMFMQGPDGKWTQSMKITYRRKK